MIMKQVDFTFETAFNFSEPVYRHVFVLHCLPFVAPHQQAKYDIKLLPLVPYTIQQDGFGNSILCGSNYNPHDTFVYGTSGRATIDFSKKQKEQPHPMYRYPSGLTQPNSALVQLSHSISSPSSDPMSCALEINELVSQRLQYLAGSTNIQTTAVQALELGTGVCQDYTHLFITLARLKGLTARYCMGLMPGEGATHAWAEVSINQQWYGFDPTHNTEITEEYITFAVGRDASDCAVERGVFRSNAVQTQHIHMEATLADQQ